MLPRQCARARHLSRKNSAATWPAVFVVAVGAGSPAVKRAACPWVAAPTGTFVHAKIFINLNLNQIDRSVSLCTCLTSALPAPTTLVWCPSRATRWRCSEASTNRGTRSTTLCTSSTWPRLTGLVLRPRPTTPPPQPGTHPMPFSLSPICAQPPDLFSCLLRCGAIGPLCGPEWAKLRHQWAIGSTCSAGARAWTRRRRAWVHIRVTRK